MRSAPSEVVVGVPDDDLAARAAAGDGGAFAELYQRYAQRLHTYCLRITGSAEDADDAVQETFVKLLGRMPEQAGAPREFAAYAYVVARNAAYDVLRRRKRAPDTDEEALATVAQPEEGERVGPQTAALIEAQRDEVQAAAAQLPERHREVLVLREVDGMSYEDIAAIMGLERNAVSQLLLRARNALRRELVRGAAGAISPATEACERAIGLLSQRGDGELRKAADGEWLADHLLDCERCRAGDAGLAEVGARYRAWTPVPIAASLWAATAKAAGNAVGADWSGLAPAGSAGPASTVAAGGGSGTGGVPAGLLGHPIAAGMGALAVVVVATTVAVGAGGGRTSPSPTPAVSTLPGPAHVASAARSAAATVRRPKRRHRKRRQAVLEQPAAVAAQPASAPSQSQSPAPAAPVQQAAPAPQPAPAPAPAEPDPVPAPQLDVDSQEGFRPIAGARIDRCFTN